MSKDSFRNYVGADASTQPTYTIATGEDGEVEVAIPKKVLDTMGIILSDSILSESPDEIAAKVAVISDILRAYSE